jgi:parallel beta-helix repeat protein
MKIVNGVLLESAGGKGTYVQAAGDGVADDTAAVQSALNAAKPGDTLHFGAGKVYRIRSPLSLQVPYVNIYGNGATLNSRELDGNALSLAAPYGGVFGLRLLGPDNSSGISADTRGNSRGIYIDADHCMVRDCRLEGFRAGGIVTRGQFGSVIGNHLIRVRNYRVEGAGFGSISGAFAHNTVIANNIISEVHNSGIGLSGCTGCIISDNFIEGADWTVDLASANSMGMNLINANRCLVNNNQIKRIENEGIILSTGGGAGVIRSSNNVIANNVITNTKYNAINLRATGGQSGTEHYCEHNVISGNAILGNSELPGGFPVPAGICLECNDSFDFCRFNSVVGNNISGLDGRLQRGFRTMGAPTRIAYNAVIDNTIHSATVVGIEHDGQFSLIDNNTLVLCGIGIKIRADNVAQLGSNLISGSITDSIVILG